MTNAGPHYNPTPDEIRAACEREQRAWSPQERSKRRKWQVTPARVPVVKEHQRETTEGE